MIQNTSERHRGEPPLGGYRSPQAGVIVQRVESPGKTRAPYHFHITAPKVNHSKLSSHGLNHCRTCEWWVRDLPHNCAECSNPGCSRVRSQAHQGCAQWVRATGADDIEPQTQKSPQQP